MDMTTLLVIVLVVILLGGGGWGILSLARLARSQDERVAMRLDSIFLGSLGKSRALWSRIAILHEVEQLYRSREAFVTRQLCWRCGRDENAQLCGLDPANA